MRLSIDSPRDRAAFHRAQRGGGHQWWRYLHRRTTQRLADRARAIATGALDAVLAGLAGAAPWLATTGIAGSGVQKDPPRGGYTAQVYKIGSRVVAESALGDVIDSGTAGTHDGQVVNSALQEASGGGKVLLMDDVTPEVPIEIPTGALLCGMGQMAPTITRPDNTQYSATAGLDALIKTENFDTLTGTDSGDVEDGVPVDFGLRDLMIDGNRFGTSNDVTTKHAVRFFGKHFQVHNVRIIRAGGTAFYSEIGSFTNNNYEEDPETDVRGLYIAQCGHDGIEWAGPGDAYLDKFIIERCGRYGLYLHKPAAYNNPKMTVGKCHIYSCGMGANIENGLRYADEIICENSTGGTGHTYDGANFYAQNFRSAISRLHCYKGPSTAGAASIVLDGSMLRIGHLQCDEINQEYGVRVTSNATGLKVDNLYIDGSNAGRTDTQGLRLESARVDIQGTIQDLDAGTQVAFADNADAVSRGNKRLDLQFHNCLTAWQLNAIAKASEYHMRYSSVTTQRSGSSPYQSDVLVVESE